MRHTYFLTFLFRSFFFLIMTCLLIQCGSVSSYSDRNSTGKELEEGFKNPPVSAKSGVYWYFMDGNLSKEGITKDLESMVRVGISHALFLEVNVGVPRGRVDMLSPEWKDIFKHMVSECERLGVQLALGGGPGWAGSGGPWVKPEESMQHLVSSATIVEGPGVQTIRLAKPDPKEPFFKDAQFTPEQRQQRLAYYKDVAVLAFPVPERADRPDDTDERALYYRAPYSSQYDVKQYLPMQASCPDATDAPDATVAMDKITDLTSRMKPDGSIEWEVPAGKWTVMRFGARNNGSTTRPAPTPGVGFESDKLDTTALSHHLEAFTGELFRSAGIRKRTQASPSGGLTMLHMDSWEMGSQNWTPKFREEFQSRRGYDPQPFYPAYAGVIVGSRELSERFLWDMRKTVQELIARNHSGYMREYARRYGLKLSIQPYDMNPIADLELAVTADVPMCEFWSVGYGYNTAFSVTEATSAAHLKGQPVVPAESFTALGDGWHRHPGNMKDQTDWALAAGITRFMFHTFQHQSLADSLRPGMTMGGIGVNWNRGQTWWEMGKAFHDYLSRSQFLLQQGRTVSDILYLCPEGNPHVFKAPVSAFESSPETPSSVFYTVDGRNKRFSSVEYTGIGLLPDKKGYAFDACPPGFLHEAKVRNSRIVFPGGAEYRILVLPCFETMTPEVLGKIKELVYEGATVVGLPPKKSPGLQNYPQCDAEVASLVKEIWGDAPVPPATEERAAGKGRIIWGEDIVKRQDNLYPDYDYTAQILQKIGIPEDFTADGSIRYTHRTQDGCDIYFVSNRTGKPVLTDCIFRIDNMIPELWDPLTGEIRELNRFTSKEKQTAVPLQFDSNGGYFIVFRKSGSASADGANFPSLEVFRTLEKPWTVSFDPKWGGPAKAAFTELADWSSSEDERIKYYSGTAVYEQSFNVGDISGKELYLHLGEVHVMAKVWLNGREAGTVWTCPWQLNISDYIKTGENELKIEVVNLWVNRMIGDDYLPYDGIQQGKWPEWIEKGTPHTRTRYTFSTFNPYNRDTPLSPSGLSGPVRILEAK
ncbi:MAG: glycosyl hydrolase [Tannerella sp.]|nr:glycosyl hydrolase [Tannerella sp.]